MDQKRRMLLLWTAAILPLAVSCGNGTMYPKHKGSIRLLQYNVCSFGKYDQSSIATAADIIRTLDADIVSLNEVDSCTLRHPEDQAKALAEELGGWSYTFARAMPYKEGAYGNAIVSKKPLDAKEPVALDRISGFEPRVAVIGETDRFVFISAHLDCKNEESMLHQVRQLSDSVKVRYVGCGKPVFLAGDMNDFPQSRVLDELRKDWDILSGTEVTFPCPDPDRTIDYIMLLKGGPEYQITAKAVPYETEGITGASDHFPVYVDIIF